MRIVGLARACIICTTTLSKIIYMRDSKYFLGRGGREPHESQPEGQDGEVGRHPNDHHASFL